MYKGDLKLNFSDYFCGAMFAKVAGAHGGVLYQYLRSLIVEPLQIKLGVKTAVIATKTLKKSSWLIYNIK